MPDRHRTFYYSGPRAIFRPFAFAIPNLKSRFERDGGHSSMVELQIVVLAVAGSSPVGHPRARFAREIPKPKSQGEKSPGLRTQKETATATMSWWLFLREGGAVPVVLVARGLQTP